MEVNIDGDLETSLIDLLDFKATIVCSCQEQARSEIVPSIKCEACLMLVIGACQWQGSSAPSPLHPIGSIQHSCPFGVITIYSNGVAQSLSRPNYPDLSGLAAIARLLMCCPGLIKWILGSLDYSRSRRSRSRRTNPFGEANNYPIILLEPRCIVTSLQQVLPHLEPAPRPRQLFYCPSRELQVGLDFCHFNNPPLPSSPTPTNLLIVLN